MASSEVTRRRTAQGSGPSRHVACLPVDRDRVRRQGHRAEPGLDDVVVLGVGKHHLLELAVAFRLGVGRRKFDRLLRRDAPARGHLEIDDRFDPTGRSRILPFAFSSLNCVDVSGDQQSAAYGRGKRQDVTPGLHCASALARPERLATADPPSPAPARRSARPESRETGSAFRRRAHAAVGDAAPAPRTRSLRGSPGPRARSPAG